MIKKEYFKNKLFLFCCRIKSGVMVLGEDGWDPLHNCTALLELNVQCMAIPVLFFTKIIKDAQCYLHLGVVISGLDLHELPSS